MGAWVKWHGNMGMKEQRKVAKLSSISDLKEPFEGKWNRYELNFWTDVSSFWYNDYNILINQNFNIFVE